MAKTPGKKIKKRSTPPLRKRPVKKTATSSKPTLRGRMAGIRKKLNGLREPGSADLFAATQQQLDALGDEIAAATDRMMTACEAIQDAADGIASKTKERGTKMRLKKIAAGTGDIFEACSFQDLTGQRLGKITRSVAVIEEGIGEITILAGANISKKSRKSNKSPKHAIDRVDGGIVLEGPQIDGPAVSQADIDKLFD
ncbi:MAG: hypothetical protein ISR51_05450 [Rhodospirillales bacterium]|nr:hypothetical protein [Alphaproteobacteria bacterium]MBL6948104.1 hypothetical protein [Rhodospirillales bacterium]